MNSGVEMRQIIAGVFGVALGVLIGGQAASAGYSNAVRLAFGAEEAGMGGACVSLADDGDAPVCNPAGMVFQEGFTATSDGALILAHPHYEDPQNPYIDGFEGGAGVGGFSDGGFVHRLKSLPVAYGIGLYTYSAIRMKYDFNTTLLTATGAEQRDVDMTLIHDRVIPSIAVQVTDNLALGAGYIRAYQTFSYATPGQFGNLVKPSALDGVNFYTDYHVDGWGQGGIFGALLKLGKKTQFGVSYTTKMAVEMNGRDEVIFQNNPLFPAPISTNGTRNNYAIAMTWKWPQVLRTGVSHQLRDDLLLAFDWQWFDWSRANDKLEYVLSNGNNAAVNAVADAVGANGGGIREAIRLDARDAHVFHFGTEYRPSERVKLRAGYVFSNNPVPDRTVSPLYSGNFMHTISLGAGTKVKTWDVDVAWSHTYLHTQVVETSEIEGGEFNFSETSNGADIFFLSLTKKF